MNPAQAGPAQLPGAVGGAPHSIELRHLRYFVALADAGSFTHAADQPGFCFADPPFRNSLPMALAFAAVADRPTAVLTGPSALAGHRPGLIRLPRPTATHDMVRVDLEDHPLTATAALVWSGDLPRPLQQILFETADGITSPAPAPARPAGLARWASYSA